jgi:hypothetical protein
MMKFLVQNHLDVDLKLAIEPWADVEIIPPGELVRFEYSEEDAEIEFAVTTEASAFVYVFSKKVTMHLKDRVVEYQ